MEENNQFSLKNKVIIITGATGVLGTAFSLDVAKAGAKVVVLGRNKERADSC
ncbi:MAG: SDR family NAD(P)-dependent oxidoreductase, partial [Pedobacter sp.]